MAEIIRRFTMSGLYPKTAPQCIGQWPISQSQWRKGILAGAIAYIIVRSSIGIIKRRRCRQKIEAKRKVTAGRREVLEQILEEDGVLLTPERASILKLDIEELVERLKTGELLPIDVLEAYQAKALEVNNDINAVVDFIIEADDWARDLENLDPEERGPLYGIPISVKECFYVKGYDSTIGMAKFINQPAEEDCAFVKAIKDLHGVPFCLTNVPQTMISTSCSNPVYGNTANPHDLSRTPGGSSGGEAALIAAGGSILGLGSDIGGSLRIPSHFSGVYALKPTNGRIYESGRRQGVGAGGTHLKLGFYAVNGFMSNSVSGVALSMKAVLQNPETMSRQDWRVVPLPWRDELFLPTRKLKIGWYDQDGVFVATPGCSRAVREVATLLEQDGHEVVQYVPPGLKEITKAMHHFLLADKGYHSLKDWDGELLDQAIEVNAINFKTPAKIKKLLAPFIWLLSKHTYGIWTSGKELSKDLWVVNANKDRLIYEFTASWEENGFDILVCPGFSFPACPPKYCSRLLAGTSYTAVFNIIGCPSGVLPVTTESKADQLELDNYPVKEDMCYRLAAAATRGAEGMPIGVQVVGRHWHEETVLHAMGIIEKLVKQKI